MVKQAAQAQPAASFENTDAYLVNWSYSEYHGQSPSMKFLMLVLTRFDGLPIRSGVLSGLEEPTWQSKSDAGSVASSRLRR